MNTIQKSGADLELNVSGVEPEFGQLEIVNNICNSVRVAYVEFDLFFF